MKSKRCKNEPQTEESGATLHGFENGDTDATECVDAAENGDLQSPQAQTRWTPECTRVMLQLRFERQLEFQQRLRQKKELWSEIAAEMRRQGLCDFSLTAEVCDLKYRNMLQTYKKNRVKEDSGMQSLIVWEYYELFKEALRAAEELEAQEGQERVVPSLLCESVCEIGNDEGNGTAVNEVGANLATVDSTVNNKSESLEMEAEDINFKVMSGHSRKRSRRSMMKVEAISPPPIVPFPKIVEDQEALHLAEKSKKENDTNISTHEVVLQQLNCKSDTHERVQRKRTCQSFSGPASGMTCMPVSTPAETLNEVAMNVVQSEPTISSTATMLMPPAIHAPLLQPQPTAPPITQTPITIVHPNNLQAMPFGLAPSEVRECQVFGESIGLQLAHVREPHIRAILQLKIQELLYLAKTNKLLDTVRIP